MPRYEAIRNVVYDREEDKVVVSFPDTSQGRARAVSTADHWDANERELREFDRMMRENQGVL